MVEEYQGTDGHGKTVETWCGVVASRHPVAINEQPFELQQQPDWKKGCSLRAQDVTPVKEQPFLLICMIQSGAEEEQHTINRLFRNKVDFIPQILTRAALGAILCRRAKTVH